MKKEIEELLQGRNASWCFPGSARKNFRALSAIARCDKKLITGDALGKIITLLCALEAKPGGPYYSSIPKKGLKNKGTIDIETNRSIAEFLSVYGIFLPNMRRYLPPGRINFLSACPEIRGEKEHFSEPDFTEEEKRIMYGIRHRLARKLNSMPGAIREPARRAFERTVRGNPDKQMALIGLYTREALGRRGKNISDAFVEEIGMANTFFWSAFIIYDDFWDMDEKAESVLLPVANMFAREHAEFFLSTPSYCLKAGTQASGKYREFFLKLMNRLDSSNCWEMEHCRTNVSGEVFRVPGNFPGYGDYSKKYEPASAHLLGPLLLLGMIGEEISGTDAINMQKYFKHLLIAMQILDDMHDFEEDLRRGHISTAVHTFLVFALQGKKKIELEKEMPEARKIFWLHAVPRLGALVLRQCALARRALGRVQAIERPAPFLHLLSLRERSAKKALSEHKESLAFLEFMSNSAKFIQSL